MEPKGNGSGYAVDKNTGATKRSIVTGWIFILVLIAISITVIYFNGNRQYKAGREDIKTQFTKAIASTQGGSVDEFDLAHINGGVLITYNFKPFSDTKVKK